MGPKGATSINSLEKELQGGGGIKVQFEFNVTSGENKGKKREKK